MTINIIEVCKIKYPGQIEAGNINFRKPEDEILIGEWNVAGVERPTEEQLKAEAAQYEAQYQLNLFQTTGAEILAAKAESVAQEKLYANAVSCASYANSTNPQWKAEAEAFIAWRDSLYAYGLSVFQAIAQGAAAPSMDEFVAGIPNITWP